MSDTPKWHIDDDRHKSSEPEEDFYADWISVRNSEGLEIARVGYSQWRHGTEIVQGAAENRDAHAALIAAAPDLLEAAEAMTKQFCGLAGGWTGIDLQIAIGKAKGGAA